MKCTGFSFRYKKVDLKPHLYMSATSVLNSLLKADKCKTSFLSIWIVFIKNRILVIFLRLNKCYSLRYTHTRLTALFPGLPGWAGTRKVKPIWILLKQERVSGGGISWAYASLHLAPDRITTPAPHHSVFYRPDALPAAQPTASKHWRHILWIKLSKMFATMIALKYALLTI